MTSHDYLSCELSANDIRACSSLALAHIGDAVYELMARTYLALSGESTNSRLHSDTVLIVSAKAQSSAAKIILPILTEEEKSVYTRGRNAHGHAAPKHTGTGEYHAATGLEALFGYLYLSGQRDRLNFLFDKIVEGKNGV